VGDDVARLILLVRLHVRFSTNIYFKFTYFVAISFTEPLKYVSCPTHDSCIGLYINLGSHKCILISCRIYFKTTISCIDSLMFIQAIMLHSALGYCLRLHFLCTLKWVKNHLLGSKPSYICIIQHYYNKSCANFIWMSMVYILS
jgi:hypothetical protein